LEWFDELNLSSISDDKLEYIITKAMGIVGHTTIPVGTHRLYRCRPYRDNNIKRGSISDLSQPPASITKEGRCNVAEKPVLYVSDNANALVKECYLSEGQRLCLLQFDHLAKVEEDLNCLMLGIEPHHALRQSPEMLEVSKFWEEFYGKEYRKYREVVSFLHRAFVRENGDGTPVYKFTSSLCERYFSQNKALDAIFYPSIANSGEWRNYAIRPDVINKAYKATKVVFCELDKDNSFKWLDGGKIEDNGDISWGHELFLDLPVGVGISRIDVDDPELYIHPLKK